MLTVESNRQKRLGYYKTETVVNENATLRNRDNYCSSSESGEQPTGRASSERLASTV